MGKGGVSKPLPTPTFGVTMECDNCKQDAHEIYHCSETGDWRCSGCRPLSQGPSDSFHVIETVNIEGYGSTSKNRVAELNRRVVMDMKKDGTYTVGRRGENGKIQDRAPDYHK